MLKEIWAALQKATFLMGDAIATVAMVLFYYSTFALFALPARFLTNYLGAAGSGSNWRAKLKTPRQLKDFKNE